MGSAGAIGGGGGVAAGGTQGLSFYDGSASYHGRALTGDVGFLDRQAGLVHGRAMLFHVERTAWRRHPDARAARVIHASCR